MGAWIELCATQAEIKAARIALATVSPTPLLVDAANIWLVGKPPTKDIFADAAKLAQETASQVSEILQIPVSKIRVIPLEIGGAFGGKHRAYLEPVAALLSKKSGHRPVKIVMSRAEVLCGTDPSSGSYIRVKMGADRRGRSTAAEASLIYEAGAYPGTSVGYIAGIIFAPSHQP